MLLLVSASLLSTGCASIFMDQAAIPGTGQRLVVGHDGGPFKRVWVVDGNDRKKVKVVKVAR